MRKYRNLSGNSGIDSYEIGKNFINVQFEEGSKYSYTIISAGSVSINEMKRLAKIGEGLNTYISKHVRKKYAAKLS